MPYERFNSAYFRHAPRIQAPLTDPGKRRRRQKVVATDEAGTVRPEITPGTEFRVERDAVLIAIGQVQQLLSRASPAPAPPRTPPAAKSGQKVLL